MAEVTEHSPGLRTFILEPERAVPRFKPGQFLHLAIDPWDPSRHWPESRAFSIASPPDQRGRLEITVSAVGAFTRRMMELKPGSEVWIKLPLGEFVVQAHEGETTVLVAGGTGITPFVSLLRAGPGAVGGNTDARVHVVYGARQPKLLLHRPTIEDAKRRWPQLAATLLAEEGAEAEVRPGRIAVPILLDAAGSGPSTFYLSGPPGMIAALRGGLAGAGVAAERILVDAWE